MEQIDLDAEFELAVEKCRQLIEEEDSRIVLSARKELNKLLGLYAKTTGEKNEKADLVNTELSQVREHLEPLGLAPEGTPVVELARLAVSKIIELKSLNEMKEVLQ